MNSTLAVAAQFQGICHVTGTILTHVKGVLPVVRGFRVTIRNNHLDNANTVKQGTIAVLVRVMHSDVGDNNTLTVVEANVHFVSSPGELIASYLERHTLGLGNINRL